MGVVLGSIKSCGDRLLSITRFWTPEVAKCVEGLVQLFAAFLGSKFGLITLQIQCIRDPKLRLHVNGYHQLPGEVFKTSGVFSLPVAPIAYSSRGHTLQPRVKNTKLWGNRAPGKIW